VDIFFPDSLIHSCWSRSNPGPEINLQGHPDLSFTCFQEEMQQKKQLRRGNHRQTPGGLKAAC
jgi:hypothetical protein